MYKMSAILTQDGYQNGCQNGAVLDVHNDVWTTIDHNQKIIPCFSVSNKAEIWMTWWIEFISINTYFLSCMVSSLNSSFVFFLCILLFFYSFLLFFLMLFQFFQSTNSSHLKANYFLFIVIYWLSNSAQKLSNDFEKLLKLSLLIQLFIFIFIHS